MDPNDMNEIPTTFNECIEKLAGIILNTKTRVKENNHLSVEDQENLKLIESYIKSINLLCHNHLLEFEELQSEMIDSISDHKQVESEFLLVKEESNFLRDTGSTVSNPIDTNQSIDKYELLKETVLNSLKFRIFEDCDAHAAESKELSILQRWYYILYQEEKKECDLSACQYVTEEFRISNKMCFNVEYSDKEKDFTNSERKVLKTEELSCYEYLSFSSCYKGNLLCMSIYRCPHSYVIWSSPYNASWKSQFLSYQLHPLEFIRKCLWCEC